MRLSECSSFDCFELFCLLLQFSVIFECREELSQRSQFAKNTKFQPKSNVGEYLMYRDYEFVIETSQMFSHSLDQSEKLLIIIH